MQYDESAMEEKDKVAYSEMVDIGKRIKESKGNL